MKIQLNAFLVRSIDAAGFDSGKLIGACNAAYNDGTYIVTHDEKVTGSRIRKGKGENAPDMFTAREASGTVREGVLTNPLRMVNLSIGLDKFHKTFGEPSGEITIDVIPAGLRFWLEGKFRKVPATPAKVETVPATATPAKRGVKPAKAAPAPVPAVPTVAAPVLNGNGATK